MLDECNSIFQNIKNLDTPISSHDLKHPGINFSQANQVVPSQDGAARAYQGQTVLQVARIGGCNTQSGRYNMMLVPQGGTMGGQISGIGPGVGNVGGQGGIRLETEVAWGMENPEATLE